MRTPGDFSAQSSRMAFSSDRLIELIARVPSALYGWYAVFPRTGCTVRPRIGRARASTSCRSPSWVIAARPRDDRARLMERPRSAPVTRGSGRRSYTSTSMPRCPSCAASTDPARPAPTTVTDCRLPATVVHHLDEGVCCSPAVVVGHVKRGGGQTDHVGITGVGDDAVLQPHPRAHLAYRRLLQPHGELGAPPARIARGDDADGPVPDELAEHRLEVPREPEAALAQVVHAH